MGPGELQDDKRGASPTQATGRAPVTTQGVSFLVFSQLSMICLRPNPLLDAVSSSPHPTPGHFGSRSQGHCRPSPLLASPLSSPQSASRTRGGPAMPGSSLSPSTPPPASGWEASLTTPPSGSRAQSGPSQLCPPSTSPPRPFQESESIAITAKAGALCAGLRENAAVPPPAPALSAPREALTPRETLRPQ